jgi:plasmid replication initiation protein
MIANFSTSSYQPFLYIKVTKSWQKEQINIKKQSDFLRFSIARSEGKKSKKICGFVYLIFKTCSQKIKG